MIDGRFLAEITKEVFTDLEANKYQFAELRLSIYGKKRDEWLLLSKWFCDFDLRCSNIKWMIQIPRLYSVYKKAKMISNFQEMIDSILVLRFLLKHADIFLPLFEASVEPSLHPEIDAFLKEIVAFDTVDDESIREPQIFSRFPFCC
jgi:AMP deaminase